MFKHLHEKFATLYVVLFVGVLALIASAVFVATTRNVEHVVRDQLTESGAIFEHLTASQNSRMQEEAGVLAHDFGFRAAVATHDAPTIRSALDNLAGRSAVDLAFVINSDGSIISRGSAALPSDAVKTIESETNDVGVVVSGGTAYETVAVPILTPGPAGWVVFAKAIGPDALRNLTQLSTLPLQVSVFSKVAGHWSLQTASASSRIGGIDALIDQSLRSGSADARKLGSDTVALVRPLPALGGAQTVLVFACPLGRAMQPFHALATTLVIVGFVALLMVVMGSWFLARTLTQPISALDDAVHRLQRGEAARVQVRTDDEIARLGLSFNAMADEIVERRTNLEHALAEAEAANQAKSVFLANMNHEVRTPLNGVVGVAAMLASTPLDAGQRKMLEMIETSGAALQRILNDVLDMVDIGARDLKLVEEPFDLGDLLDSLIGAASAQAFAKGLNFYTLFDVGQLGWVRGDQARVRQILVNILDNAIKFTPAGQVSVGVDHNPDGGVWRFEIKDTGIGFDPARAEALFTAFNQADGSMTRRAGGTGLGLSLARDLARAMGGDIAGYGVPGEGASFVFSLPLAASEPVAQPVRAEAKSNAASTLEPDAPEANLPPVRILLADDHAANRMVIEMILSSVDTDVVSVQNGQEAVEAFRLQSFDVVLMDLQMPVMDGLTAIKLIREHELQTQSGRTPVIVISANVQAYHLRASAEAGADSHLAKPILAPTLFEALEDCLSPTPETALRIAV